MQEFADAGSIFCYEHPGKGFALDDFLCPRHIVGGVPWIFI